MKKQILVILAVLVASALAVRFARMQNAESDLVNCKENLKNLGTAMEMYSTDWSGRYSSAFAKLTPNYLKTLPECPAARAMTYRMESGVESPHNTQGFQDYYFMYCEGDFHRDMKLPSNYPVYDGIASMGER